MGRVSKAIRERLSEARETIGLYRSWSKGKGYYPHTVELLITAPCNARCTFCNVWHPDQAWRSDKSKKELTLEAYVRLFDELSALGTKLLFVSGGEPFLRKDTVAVLREAKKRGFELLVVTNGGVFNAGLAADLIDIGVDTLAFSIDAPRPDIHNSLRGSPGLWEKAVASIALVREARRERAAKKPVISVWYAVSHESIGLIGEMLEARDKIGYDTIGFQPMISKTARAQGALCTIEDISRLQDQLPSLRSTLQRVGLNAGSLNSLSGLFLDPAEASRGRYASRINENVLCFTPFLVANIDPYGVVYPCCYADTYQNLGDDGAAPYWGSEEYSLGDITKQSFTDIWSGAAYEQLRRRFQEPPDLPFCQGCGYQVSCRETSGRRTKLFLSGSFVRSGLIAAGRSTWRDVRRLFGAEAAGHTSEP